MARRMALFCGVPTALGIATFVASYIVVSHGWFKPPNVAVVLVSIVGTQITDLLTDGLNVSLYASTAAFAVALAAIFFVWHRVEGTLSIDTIVTPRRELFYWAAILCTFALGTAAGDLATEALGLGFTLGALCFGGLIAAVFVTNGNGLRPPNGSSTWW